jgi:hypothetical protein
MKKAAEFLGLITWSTLFIILILTVLNKGAKEIKDKRPAPLFRYLDDPPTE